MDKLIAFIFLLTNLGSFAAPSSPKSGAELFRESSCIAVAQCSELEMIQNTEFGPIMRLSLIRSTSFKGGSLPKQINIAYSNLPYEIGFKLNFKSRFKSDCVLLLQLIRLKENYYRFASRDMQQAGGIDFKSESLLNAKTYEEFLLTALDNSSDDNIRRNLIFMMGGLESEAIRNRLAEMMKSGPIKERAYAFDAALYAIHREIATRPNGKSNGNAAREKLAKQASEFLQSSRDKLPQSMWEHLQHALEDH